MQNVLEQPQINNNTNWNYNDSIAAAAAVHFSSDHHRTLICCFKAFNVFLGFPTNGARHANKAKQHNLNEIYDSTKLYGKLLVSNKFSFKLCATKKNAHTHTQQFEVMLAKMLPRVEHIRRQHYSTMIFPLFGEKNKNRKNSSKQFVQSITIKMSASDFLQIFFLSSFFFVKC